MVTKSKCYWGSPNGVMTEELDCHLEQVQTLVAL